MRRVRGADHYFVLLSPFAFARYAFQRVHWILGEGERGREAVKRRPLIATTMDGFPFSFPFFFQRPLLLLLRYVNV